MSAQLAAAQAAAAASSDELASVKADAAQLQIRLDQMMQATAENDTFGAQMKAALDEANAQIAALNRELSETQKKADSELQNVRAQLAEAKEEAKQLNASRDQAQELASQNAEETTRAAEELEALRVELEKAQATVARLENSGSIKDKELIRLNNSVQELTDQLQSANGNSISDEEAAIIAAVENLRAARDAYGSLGAIKDSDARNKARNRLDIAYNDATDALWALILPKK